MVQVAGLAANYSHLPGGVAAAPPVRSRDLVRPDMYLESDKGDCLLSQHVSLSGDSKCLLM